MRKLETFQLVSDGFDNLGIAMSKTGNRGAAGSIQVALAGAVDYVNSLTLYREGVGDLTVAGKNVTHLINRLQRAF
jgi:hypothetical protein